MKKMKMKRLALCILAAVAMAIAADPTLMQPQELVAKLQAKNKPAALIHVGFNVLYRSKHIPNSIYAGPGSTPAGLAMLRAAVTSLPRDGEVVIYCGCCPWDHCPNMKPAMELLKQMGFTKAKALYIPENMAADWFNKGYPAEQGTAK